MRWLCQYVNAKGVRCTARAVWRIHFAAEHPFDHTDCCATHFSEYKFFCWKQSLPEDWSTLT